LVRAYPGKLNTASIFEVYIALALNVIKMIKVGASVIREGSCFMSEVFAQVCAKVLVLTYPS
jgi:hypothetical protein